MFQPLNGLIIISLVMLLALSLPLPRFIKLLLANVAQIHVKCGKAHMQFAHLVILLSALWGLCKYFLNLGIRKHLYAYEKTDLNENEFARQGRLLEKWRYEVQLYQVLFVCFIWV